jgi:hypothetical protein
VRAGGVLAGVVVPDDLARRLPAGIVLRAAGLVAGQRRRELAYASIGGDGSFAVRAVPDGSWTVHVAYRPEGRHDPLVMDAALAHVTLREGERRELRVDAAAVAPCRLRGRLVIDGEPVALASFWLATARHTPSGVRLGSYGGGTTDAAGHFTIGALPPGSYKPRVKRQLPGAAQEELVTPDEWTTLAAAEDRFVSWDLTPRHVRIRVLGPGDRPVRRARILITAAADGGAQRIRATDQEGWLELPAAPAGTLHLQLFAAADLEGFTNDELRGLAGSVAVPAHAREHTVEARLAPRAAPPR